MNTTEKIDTRFYAMALELFKSMVGEKTNQVVTKYLDIPSYSKTINGEEKKLQLSRKWQLFYAETKYEKEGLKTAIGFTGDEETGEAFFAIWDKYNDPLIAKFQIGLPEFLLIVTEAMLEKDDQTFHPDKKHKHVWLIDTPAGLYGSRHTFNIADKVFAFLRGVKREKKENRYYPLS